MVLVARTMLTGPQHHQQRCSQSRRINSEFTFQNGSHQSYSQVRLFCRLRLGGVPAKVSSLHRLRLSKEQGQTVKGKKAPGFFRRIRICLKIPFLKIVFDKYFLRMICTQCRFIKIQTRLVNIHMAHFLPILSPRLFFMVEKVL